MARIGSALLAACLAAGIYIGDDVGPDADVPTEGEEVLRDELGIAAGDLVRVDGRPGRYRVLALSYDGSPYLLAPAERRHRAGATWADPARVTPD